jgi:outer membrane protein assembly factor BamB
MAVLLAIVDAPRPEQEARWPMFRGPNATGLADGAIPVNWSVPDGRGIRWKTPMPGTGHSSPIVWGDRVFVTTAVAAVPRTVPRSSSGRATVKDDGVQTWRVYCLDRSTGKVLWERTAHSGEPKIGRHPKASHANSTPVTDGRHVVAYFGSEGLYTYDMNGRLLWSKDLGVIDVGYVGLAEYQWSTASSPVIHGGRVIIQADSHERSFMAAFDVATGREVWRHTRDELPSWTTPVVASGPGGDVLVTNAPKYIRGLDPATGRELWRVEDTAVVKVPTPVVAGGLVVASGGNPSGRPFHAIRPGASISAERRVAWTAPKGGPYTPTPIVVDGLLYILADNGVLSSYDLATGRP